MHTFANPLCRQEYRLSRSDARIGRLVCSLRFAASRKFILPHLLARRREFENGVLAQLVERLNGIEEVRGSNPLGSISFIWMDLRIKAQLSTYAHNNFERI